MQSDSIPSAGSGISSVEEVEAIVRRVLADALAQQHGGPVASRSTSSGEVLDLKDSELPDDLDLGSTFTVVTLPNEIKQGGGEGEKGAVSRSRRRIFHLSQSPLSGDVSHQYIAPSIYYAFHNTERRRRD